MADTSNNARVLVRTIEGPSKGDAFVIEPGGKLRFGRHPPSVDVLLTYGLIGRIHFVIENEQGICFFEHRSGIKLTRPQAELIRNDSRTTFPAIGRHRLEIGDVICITGASFRLELPAETIEGNSSV